SQAPDSLAALRGRLARDSADGRGWLLLGRADLARFEAARARRPAPDSAWARAVLDTVDQALARAALLLGPPGATPEGAVAADLRLGARGAGEGWVAALAARRAVCASMALEGPPEGTPRAAVAWQTRTLVWVVGLGAPGDRVPPGDFAFTALKLALAARDP